MINVVSYLPAVLLRTTNLETKSSQDVPVKVRIDTQLGAILENTKSSEVQKRKERMVATSLDVYYSLMACQCDNDGKCIDNDPTSPNFEGQMLHQGDEVKICIQFDQDFDLPPEYVHFADVKTLTCSQDSLFICPLVTTNTLLEVVSHQSESMAMIAKSLLVRSPIKVLRCRAQHHVLLRRATLFGLRAR